MTLAKMCHASNMMQVLEKATHRPIANHESFLKCGVSSFHRCIEKIESHLET